MTAWQLSSQHFIPPLLLVDGHNSWGFLVTRQMLFLGVCWNEWSLIIFCVIPIDAEVVLVPEQFQVLRLSLTLSYCFESLYYLNALLSLLTMLWQSLRFNYVVHSTVALAQIHLKGNLWRRICSCAPKNSIQQLIIKRLCVNGGGSLRLHVHYTSGGPLGD